MTQEKNAEVLEKVKKEFDFSVDSLNEENALKPSFEEVTEEEILEQDKIDKMIKKPTSGNMILLSWVSIMLVAVGAIYYAKKIFTKQE
eukprot:gene10381-2910_t